MRTFVFLVFSPIIFASKKNFTVERFVDCPEKHNLPIKTFLTFNAALNKPNQVYVFGRAEVFEAINGPVEVLYELNRRDLGSQKCEKFLNLKV